MMFNELFKSDWRYQGQDKYLYCRKLLFKNFSEIEREHDHCEFCWDKFGKEENMLKQG